MTDFQPTLPAEVPLSDAELAFLDESPPGLFPENQDSNFGYFIRKIFSDRVQELIGQQDTIWNEKFVATALQFLDEWERVVDLPVDTGVWTPAQRRNLILNRLRKGAFTHAMRQSVVESFITATFGDAPAFDPTGISLSGSGIPLYSGINSLAGTYNIIEDIANFLYHVRIRDTVGFDDPGLTRELTRVTPAGIQFDIAAVHDPFMDKTGALVTSGNEITDARRAEGIGVPVVGHSYDGLSGDSSFGIWESSVNLVLNGNFTTNATGWAPAGTSTLVRYVGDGVFGNTSGRLQNPAAPGNSVYGGYTTINVVGGSTYVLSAWVKKLSSAANGKGRLGIFWYDADGAPITPTTYGAYFPVGPSTSFFKSSITVDAPGRAATAKIIITADADTGVIDYLFGGVQFENRRSAVNLTTSGNEITDTTRKAALSWPVTQQGGQTDGRGSTPGWKNLVTNGSFEIDTSNWTLNQAGGVVARDTTNAKYGAASLRFDKTNSGVVMASSARYAFSAGEYLSASADFFWPVAPGTNAFVFRIEALDSSGTLIGYLGKTGWSVGGADEGGVGGRYYVPATTIGAWFRFNVVATAPTPANTASISIIFFSDAVGITASAPLIYLDGVQVEAGTVAHAFVDGTQSSAFTSPDSSFGIRRAATNLFRHGQCDATTDWNASGAGLTTRSIDPTTPAPFASQSIKFVLDGTANTQGVQASSGSGLAALAGTLGVCSSWFKGVAGASYIARTKWNNTDATATEGADGPFVATGEWQLVTAPNLAVAAGKTGDILNMRIITSNQRAETLWAAHAMLEIGQSVVAPYVATSGGATAIHGNSRVQAPPALLNPVQGWVAARVRMGIPSPVNVGGDSPGIFSLGDGTAVHRIGVFAINGTSQWQTRRSDGTTIGTAIVNDSWNVGDYRTVICKWNATTIGISINGAPFVSTDNNGVPPASSFDIGQCSGTINFLNGEMLWLMSGTGTLTDADAMTLYNLGNTDPNVDTTLPTTAVVTAVWKADGPSYLTPGATTEIATPYVHTDGATAARSVAHVEADASLLSVGGDFGVVIWARPEWDAVSDQYGGGGNGPSVFSWGASDANGYYQVYMREGDNGWRLRLGDNAAARVESVVTATHNAGNVIALCARVQGDTPGIGLNGGAFAGVTGPNTSWPIRPTATIFEIGSFTGTSGWFNGEILCVLTFTGTISSAEWAAIYALGPDRNYSDYQSVLSSAEITAIIPLDDSNYYVKV